MTPCSAVNRVFIPYLFRIAQARLDSQRAIVLDASVLDVDAEKQFPVSLVVPAHVVVDAGDFDVVLRQVFGRGALRLCFGKSRGRDWR